MKEKAKIKNFIFIFGLNLDEELFFFFLSRKKRIKILINSAITPPSLFGIARRIAYAKRKYHSGWMWMGVTIGFAILKFSGSPKKLGFVAEKKNKMVIKMIMGVRSFHEKNGWNFIVSLYLFNPKGLEDLYSWREMIWINDIPKIIKGAKKCNEKKRFNVAFATENPPHSHCTILTPAIGIAEAKLVITVAPQKDICPHGRTYPKNAAAIVIRRIKIPEDQVSFFIKEENIIPREMWIYIKIKNLDAPFIWIFRINQPLFTSRIMWAIDSNA